MSNEGKNDLQINLKPIGTIRTPYKERAPYQPIERDIGEGKFRLILEPKYEEASVNCQSLHIYTSCLTSIGRLGGKR